MRSQTRELKEQLAREQPLQQKLDLLESAYEGETCYLLTCGPSVAEVWSERAASFLADKLVVAVKQTHDLAPGIVDFHLLNPWNFQPYQYGDPGPIVIAANADGDPETPGMQPDLLFRIPEPRNYARRLATTYHFDEWLFSKSLDRPWGPGIMYELGFYLAAHIGVQNIVTLGWDLGERNSNVMEHYFAEADPGSDEVDGISNKPRIRSFEVDDIAASTRALYYWLRAKGIGLSVVSDRSLVDGVVPRVGLYSDPSTHQHHRVELVANGAFEGWEGQVPSFWETRGRVSCEVSDKGHAQLASLGPAPPGQVAQLQQQFPIDEYFRGGVVRARAQAMSRAPQSLSLYVELARHEGDAHPVRETIHHPGDSRWHSLAIDVKVPDSIPIRWAKVGLELAAGAEQPARIERVTAILEK